MSRYLLKRFSFLLLTLLLTSLIIFFITQLLPGDVARIILGREASEAALANLRQSLGLDKPPLLQYLNWLGRFVVGDWGTSYSLKENVRPLVLESLGNSLQLASLTFIIAVPTSIFLGIVAGVWHDTWLDYIISIGSLSVVGLPEFITGFFLIQLFAFRWQLLPANSSVEAGTSFLTRLPMLILPALTATFVLLAYVTRLTRASVIEELNQPYVRTALLKGLPQWQVISKHVLRNALLPTITVLAISVGWLISGLIVVENVFNYPGFGRLLIFAIERHDLPLLQAITFVTVIGFAVSNLLADILYAYLNPRIKLE